MAPLMGNDEQATFTLIRNAGVLQDFLGFRATPIQGHHRTTVSYGQIEIDEAQAGIDKGVNLHSKLTHRDHSKLTHLRASKAHRRAAPI